MPGTVLALLFILMVDKTKKKKKVRFRNEGALVNGSYLLIVTRSQ